MRTKITAQTFSAVKIMLKGGATHKEVAEFLQVSEITVARINRAETLEEYRQQMCAVQMKYKQQKKAPVEAYIAPAVPDDTPQVVTLPPRKTPEMYYLDNRIIEELRKQNELLTYISNKLAFIVEQLS